MLVYQRVTWIGDGELTTKAIYGWSYGGYLSAMCLAKAIYVGIFQLVN